MRLAIVGIGSDQNPADGLGVWVARALRVPPDVLVLDAGSAPENVTGALGRFKPDVVLLLDAAEMGAPPGSVRLLDYHTAEGAAFSTHSISLELLADYLERRLRCTVWLLGIQPERDAAQTGLSPRIVWAARALVRALDAFARIT